jgi:raffinose/stachyose/melibiose transport system substrate-binding protein
MTHKRPVWAILLAVVALIVVACAPAATPTPETVVVTQMVEGTPQEVEVTREVQVEVTTAPEMPDIRLVVWFLSGSPEEIQINHDLMDKWAASYDKAHVTIDFTSMGYEDYNNAMKLALDAHSGPDLAYGSPGGPFSTAWGEAGHLIELTDFLKTSGIDQKVPEGIILYFNPGGYGHIYTVEYDAVAIGTYYNADMFEKNGWKVPTTMDEMDQLLADIKAAGITPLAEGAQTPWAIEHPFSTLTHTITPWDEYQAWSDCKGPTPQQWVTAAAKLKSWVDAGYFNDNMLATSVDDGSNLFLTQQAAMTIAGSWNNATFGAQTDFTARFFPVPRMDPTLPEYHLAGFTPNNGWSVPVYSEHQEAALDLLTYMVASDDSALARWNGGNNVSYNFDTQPDPVYQVQADVQAAMNEALPGTYDGQAGGDIGPTMGANIQALVGGEKTPEQVIADIDADVQKTCKDLANSN